MNWHLPRRFPPTREGWWFLGSTLVVGAAAINGGINLLFLVFGMLLSLILVSGILSELCLRDLKVIRRPPASIHAGSPFLMGISVRNNKKRIPTFALEIEDLVGEKPVDRRCYYLKLPASKVQETAYRNMLPTRGRHHLTGLRLSTRFPFGLIRKSRDVPAPLDLLVYPALVPVPDNLLPAGAMQLGQKHTARASRSGDFHGLREFRQGDDPRDIHWRTSARRGRAFVREFEDESSRIAVVVFGTSGTLHPDSFEAAVSTAASIAVKLLKRGYLVGLHTGDTSIPAAGGPTQAGQILKCLALVTPAAAALPVARLAKLSQLGGCIQVAPGPGGTRISVLGPGLQRRSA